MMNWPERVKLWLEIRNLDKYLEYTLAYLYETAFDVMENADPKEIIKQCDGKYSTFAYDAPILCPICEEDRKENEHSLAHFYTTQIIAEVWDGGDYEGDDCDTFPGVM